MRPQLHHTVPRAYLKGFADGKTVVLRRRDGTVAAAGLKRVAAEVDFYTFFRDGERDQGFETFLANEVDAPAATVLAAMREDGEAPTGEARASFVRWLAFQIVRTTHVRYLMTHATEPTARAAYTSIVMRELAKRPESASLDPEQKRRIAMDAWARTPPEFFRRDAVADLRIVARKGAEFADRLAGWQCFVLRAQEPDLVTSDNPVALLHPEPDKERWAGVFPEGADVQLALSPTMLVVLTPYPRVGGDALTPAAVRAHNEAMARDAHQAVIHHPRTVWPVEWTLAPRHQELPPARVRLSTSDPATPPTFPTTYPPITDPAIAKIVEDLGGSDLVD